LKILRPLPNRIVHLLPMVRFCGLLQDQSHAIAHRQIGVRVVLREELVPGRNVVGAIWSTLGTCFANSSSAA
jgi:hypothetical protein